MKFACHKWDQVSGRCFHEIGHAHSGRGLSTFKLWNDMSCCRLCLGVFLKTIKTSLSKEGLFVINLDIDKNNTEISPHEVQNETGDTRTNELSNEIEKSKKEKDRVIAQEKKLVSTLTEINQRILKVDDRV
ncbi:hypothetical protein Tco_1258316 [Tanacetum coccineum]